MAGFKHRQTQTPTRFKPVSLLAPPGCCPPPASCPGSASQFPHRRGIATNLQAGAQFHPSSRVPAPRAVGTGQHTQHAPGPSRTLHLSSPEEPARACRPPSGRAERAEGFSGSSQRPDGHRRRPPTAGRCSQILRSTQQAGLRSPGVGAGKEGDMSPLQAGNGEGVPGGRKGGRCHGRNSTLQTGRTEQSSTTLSAGSSLSAVAASLLC